MKVEDRLEALEFLLTHIIAQTPGLAEAVRDDLQEETRRAPWAAVARQWLSIAEHLPAPAPPRLTQPAAPLAPTPPRALRRQSRRQSHPA
jgi:hypothetical protein